MKANPFIFTASISGDAIPVLDNIRRNIADEANDLWSDQQPLLTLDQSHNWPSFSQPPSPPEVWVVEIHGHWPRQSLAVSGEEYSRVGVAALSPPFLSFVTTNSTPLLERDDAKSCDCHCAALYSFC